MAVGGDYQVTYFKMSFNQLLIIKITITKCIENIPIWFNNDSLLFSNKQLSIFPYNVWLVSADHAISFCPQQATKLKRDGAP